MISHVLFTTAQMDQQVELITKTVGHEYTIPTGIEIYSASKINAYKSKHHMIFKVTIPLLSIDYFSFFKIFNVPFIRDDRFVRVVNDKEYLITSRDRQYYRTTDDFRSNCIESSERLICRNMRVWYSSEHPTCAWNLFNHRSRDHCKLEDAPGGNVFFELESNKFIFSCLHEIEVVIVCMDAVFNKNFFVLSFDLV